MNYLPAILKTIKSRLLFAAAIFLVLGLKQCERLHHDGAFLQRQDEATSS